LGLGIHVGALVGIFADDHDGLELAREELERLNVYLASVGLPAHREPEDVPPWGASVGGYSRLHLVRRIAAHLALSGALPPPGGRMAAEDPVLAAYYREPTRPAGILRQRKPLSREFDHLIRHSDAEGYYLPIDFPDVLVPDRSYGIPGGMIGSSIRLLAECRRVAQALGIPPELGLDGAEAHAADMEKGEGEGWRAYAIESLCCLQLIRAAEHSIEHRAAIVFG
jgi:hypothetical protein